MAKSKDVFLWAPADDKLPESVKAELHGLRECAKDSSGLYIDRYYAFDWDDEDNESFPAIAEFMAKRYNKYFFFVDLHNSICSASK